MVNYTLNLHSYWMTNGINLLTKDLRLMLRRIKKEKATPIGSTSTHRDGLTEQQVAQLCSDATLSRLARAAISILFVTGARPGNIIPAEDISIALRWTDIECAGATAIITFRLTKNTLEYGTLRRSITQVTGPHDPMRWIRYLFRHRHNGNCVFAADLRNEIALRLKKMSTPTKRYTMYSFRIGLVTRLTAAGVPAPMIMELMGWKSLASYARYLRLDERFAQRAAACLTVPAPASNAK